MYKVFLPFLFLLVLPIHSQTVSSVITQDEKLNFIGMTLTELIELLGVPKTVAAVRGNETWQDDVVFQYTDADYYIHNDRVWQARFPSACGISIRNRKAAVMLLLGSDAVDNDTHALLTIPRAGKSWPIMLRINFNSADPAALVSSIYIYRPDY